jgi:flagellar hook-length control protein FliK
MLTSSPALAFLAIPPAGKDTASTAGPSPQNAARHVTEAGSGAAATDSADTPDDGPSFAKMLRDQAAAERGSDPGPVAASPAKADAPTEAADTPKATPQTSEQLTAWLAALIKGQTPGQGQEQPTGKAPEAAAQTAPSGAEQLSRLAARTSSAAALKGRGDAKTTQADKSAVPDEKAARPGTGAAVREAAPAAREALIAAVSAQTSTAGQKPLAAAAVASTEASPTVKSTVQRPSAADLSTLPMALAGLAHSSSATPASGAPTSATPVVDTAVSQDIRRPEFVPVFSARIATLVQEGVEQARVHLNPVDMGPVSLQLSMDGLQVRVDMTAEVAATRLVLEQALPTLAGALREAGFTLSGGGVSPPAEAANLSGQDPRGAGGSQGEPNPQASGQSTGLAGQQADGRRPPEAQAGRTPFTGASGTADGLTTELQLDAEGRPRLPQGRGLVDTFA